MTQKQLIIVAAAVAFVLLLIGNTFYILTPTRYALVTAFGAPVAIVTKPGLKTKVPFVQMVEFFDSRILDYYMPSPMEINASDQKRIVVGAYLKWRITDPLKFAQTTRAGLGGDRMSLMNDRLATILESSLRQALGGYPLSALLSPKRAEIMHEIRAFVNQQVVTAALDDKADDKAAQNRGFGVEIVDVRIVHADLPKENSEAIFKRMQTERDREAKQFRAQGEEEGLRIRAKADRERTVLIAEAQKKAETTRGEGEGEAANIYAESFGKDPKFYEFYRSMQAYNRSFSNKDTTMVLSPGSKFLKQMEGE